MAYLNGKKVLFGTKLVPGMGKFRAMADGTIAEITAEDLRGITKICDNAFQNRRALETVELPNGVISIGTYAFDACNALVSIEIPDSVTKIGSYALWIGSTYNKATITMRGKTPPTIQIDTFYASHLKEIVAPAGSVYDYTQATNWSWYADYIVGDKTITALTADDFDGASIGNYAYYRCKQLKAVAISDSVTSIGESAFRECSALVEIKIPDSVTVVGAYAFRNCGALSRIWIENPNGVKCIDEGTFWGCRALKSAPIPSGVTSIGNTAFKNCTALESVYIPESVTAIGKSAFHQCTALTTVNLPSGLPYIRGSLFYGCSSLENIKIPDGIDQISGSAFYGCSSLTALTIPSGVERIEDNALCIGSTTNKATITMLSKTPPTMTKGSAFDVNTLEKIIVPAGCGATYKAETNWSVFADYIEEEEA